MPVPRPLNWVNQNLESLHAKCPIIFQDSLTVQWYLGRSSHTLVMKPQDRNDSPVSVKSNHATHTVWGDWAELFFYIL